MELTSAGIGNVPRGSRCSVVTSQIGRWARSSRRLTRPSLARYMAKGESQQAERTVTPGPATGSPLSSGKLAVGPILLMALGEHAEMRGLKQALFYYY